MSVDIAFLHSRLESVRFNVRDFATVTEAPSQIVVNVALGVDTTIVRVALRIIEENPERELLYVSYEGVFKMTDTDNGTLSENDVLKCAKINCAAMLFPFVREFVAEITRRAAVGPLIINSVNFVAMFEQSQKVKQ